MLFLNWNFLKNITKIDYNLLEIIWKTQEYILIELQLLNWGYHLMDSEVSYYKSKK